MTVVGSIVGTRKDLSEVFELHASGRTTVVRETRPLSSINESIEDILHGRTTARIVFDINGGRETELLSAPQLATVAG